jgi:hypothetical protein
MSETTWTQRVFTAAEAADMAGLRRSQLDQWIIRQPADLFSQKRGFRRWFSAQDIAIIAMARQLERGGKVLLSAIACAFDNLQEPPAADAIFVVEAESVSHRSGRFISDRDVPRLAVDKTQILIPAGKIVAGIIAACEALRAA